VKTLHEIIMACFKMHSPLSIGLIWSIDSGATPNELWPRFVAGRKFMRKILCVLPLSVLFVACGMEKSTPAGGNAGATDTGSIDTGVQDTGAADTGIPDTGTTDTGSTDAGSGDTGSTDAGSTDTGSTDTFICDDGSEILVAFRCDGIRTLGASLSGADCADGSDEANCPPSFAAMVPRFHMNFGATSAPTGVGPAGATWTAPMARTRRTAQ